jgi:hypothetical protein
MPALSDSFTRLSYAHRVTASLGSFFPQRTGSQFTRWHGRLPAPAMLAYLCGPAEFAEELMRLIGLKV